MAVFLRKKRYSAFSPILRSQESKPNLVVVVDYHVEMIQNRDDPESWPLDLATPVRCHTAFETVFFEVRTFLNQLKHGHVRLVPGSKMLAPNFRCCRPVRRLPCDTCTKFVNG